VKVTRYCGIFSLGDKWVIPEKIHTPPTDGKLEILAGGGLMAREIRAEGGI